MSEEPFEYSSFPGRFGTPLVASILATTVVFSALTSRNDALLACGTGLTIATLCALMLLGDAVLAFPLLRRRGVNLVATRGANSPEVFLVAHLDSKSQPVSSALRVVGAFALSGGLVLLIIALVVNLGTLRFIASAISIIGAIPLVLSVVGNRSAGAVDNASGVAAVLSAAERLTGDAVGVVITSAEELGLAGARAWSRKREPGTALNCDGVDDAGQLVVMFNGSRPHAVVDALRSGAPVPPSERRMPIGLLTDSTALAKRGWNTATVSFGSLATLRRVHTPGDSLAVLRGENIELVAGVLATAAEELVHDGADTSPPRTS